MDRPFAAGRQACLDEPIRFGDDSQQDHRHQLRVEAPMGACRQAIDRAPSCSSYDFGEAMRRLRRRKN
jgi:hypothetical protein